MTIWYVCNENQVPSNCLLKHICTNSLPWILQSLPKSRYLKSLQPTPISSTVNAMLRLLLLRKWWRSLVVDLDVRTAIVHFHACPVFIDTLKVIDRLKVWHAPFVMPGYAEKTHYCCTYVLMWMAMSLSVTFVMLDFRSEYGWADINRGQAARYKTRLSLAMFAKQNSILKTICKTIK